MEKSNELTLTFKGQEFDEGFNLFYLAKGLTNINSLIDKSYLTIEAKQKMTERDREVLQVKTYNVRTGSFEADFFIQLGAVTGSLLPMVTSLSPNDVWSLVTESFKYLNTVIAGHSRGEQFHFEQTESTNVINIVNSENVTVQQIHPDVLENVRKSAHTFEQLTKLIAPEKGVESISVRDKDLNKKQFFIGVEEKMNFENRKRLDPNPVVFMGQIYKVDGEGFNGKLKVIDGAEHIKEGEYKFEFLLKDDTEKLRNAFLKIKRISALRETILNPATLDQRIHKLKIIDVK